MASTYVNDLRLNEMATGDASGTWGTVTNTNLELIGEALGYGTEGITTNANTHTTTVADGATDPGRAMYIEYTGTLDSACTITIAPNTLNRMHFIENGTSGSQNIIIKQGSGATITIPPGDTKAVYLDGAGSGAAVVDAFASLSVVDLKVQDDLTVTDDMTVGGTLGVTGTVTIAGDIDLAGGIDVDGTSNLDIVDIDGAVNIAAATTIATTNKIQFRDTAIHISSPADGDMHIAADDEIDITSTLIDINGAVDMSANLTIAGDIDLAGGIDVDGTSNLDIVDIDGAVNMATTALVTGVLTTTAATVFNGGFAANDGSTITTADNTTQLALISTDADAAVGPVLELYRNSSSPADNDNVGQINWFAENDADEKIKFAEIRVDTSDVSNGSEDARVLIQTATAGSIGVSRLEILPAESVFNQDSVDVDFRVESNGSTHMLFVDGGTNKILMSSNPASDTQSTPHDTLKLAVAYSSSGADGAAGLGPRIVFSIPDDETNPSVGGGIAVVKAVGDDSNSSADMTFALSQNDETLDEHMRIQAGGLVCIGDTTERSGNQDTIKGLQVSSGENVVGIKNETITDSSQRGMIIFTINDNSAQGRITCNNSSTLFTSLSDYRLKEVLEPLPNGLDRLNKLNPVKFKWKKQGYNAEGFLAHEVAEIVPEAVSGKKDGEDMQSMDYGRITPLLVKAIQEQQEQIEQLKTEISKLH